MDSHKQATRQDASQRTVFPQLRQVHDVTTDIEHSMRDARPVSPGAGSSSSSNGSSSPVVASLAQAGVSGSLPVPPRAHQQSAYQRLMAADPELGAAVGACMSGLKDLKQQLGKAAAIRSLPANNPAKAAGDSAFSPFLCLNRIMGLKKKASTLNPRYLFTSEQQAVIDSAFPELTRMAQQIESDLTDLTLQLVEDIGKLAVTQGELAAARTENNRLQQEGQGREAATAADKATLNTKVLQLEDAARQLEAALTAGVLQQEQLQALLVEVSGKMVAALELTEAQEATIDSQKKQLEEAGSALQSVQTELDDLKTQHTLTTQNLEKALGVNKDLNTQIDGLRGTNAQLTTDKSELQERAETLRREVDNLTTQLKSARDENAEITKNLQTAADRITDLTGQLTTAQASNSRLTSDNNALRQVAEGRLQQLRDGAQALAGVQRQLDYLVLNQQPLIYAKAVAERRAAEATTQVTQLTSELHQRDEALRQRDEALRHKAEELRQKDSQLETLQWTTGAALQGMRQRMALAEHKADTAALTTIEDERTIRALKLEATDLTSQLHIAQAAAAHKAAKVEAEQARCAELERCHQETMADKVRLQLEWRP